MNRQLILEAARQLLLEATEKKKLSHMFANAAAAMGLMASTAATTYGLAQGHIDPSNVATLGAAGALVGAAGAGLAHYVDKQVKNC
jgi:uncharacterized membrane protein YfcA